MVTIVLLTKRYMLSEPPGYLKHVADGHRKFFRYSWEKLFCSKYVNQSQSQVRIFWWNLIFWAEIIFSPLCLEHVVWPSGTCLGYLGGFLNIDLCFSNWIRDHAVHQCGTPMQYIRKSKTNCILKMKLKVSLEYSDKTWCF